MVFVHTPKWIYVCRILNLILQFLNLSFGLHSFVVTEKYIALASICFYLIWNIKLHTTRWRWRSGGEGGWRGAIAETLGEGARPVQTDSECHLPPLGIEERQGGSCRGCRCSTAAESLKGEGEWGEREAVCTHIPLSAPSKRFSHWDSLLDTKFSRPIHLLYLSCIRTTTYFYSIISSYYLLPPHFFFSFFLFHPIIFLSSFVT